MAIDEKIIIFRENVDQFENELLPDISEAIVSFTNIGNKEESKYIYDGHEKIPFDERDSLYQEIMIKEFLLG